jgi:hypothetical protein
MPRVERAAASGLPAEEVTNRTAIPRMDEMPNIPQPFKMQDWRQVARDYVARAFNLNAKGEYMPLVWIDKSHINLCRTYVTLTLGRSRE